MKRFHIHVGVKDLEKSVAFYSTLFGQKPTKLKNDYAKWMLEDPRVNFAISTRVDAGVDHLGLQVDEDAELSQITERLKNAKLDVKDEGETTCCYSESKKAWTEDPSGVAWEAYRTMADADLFHAKSEATEDDGESCCSVNEEASEEKQSCC